MFLPRGAIRGNIISLEVFDISTLVANFYFHVNAVEIVVSISTELYACVVIAATAAVSKTNDVTGSLRHANPKEDKSCSTKFARNNIQMLQLLSSPLH
jgi:hypothetical protein